MERYCPECHSNMTPSLVGYLCVNCGHVQRFYSNTEAALATPASMISLPVSHTSHGHKNESKNESIKGKKQIKATLKRLMVPELPNPLENDEISKANEPKTDVVSGSTNPSIMPIPATRSEGKLGSISDTPIPNQSSDITGLQAALHPKRDTSLWVLISLAILLLAVAAVLLMLIIVR